MNQFGYFGKTPHRGDFVRFNLPGTYVTVWDDWLQQLMTAGEEKHNGKWPAIYTTAPSYRFALSEGIVGEAAWAGLLIPSVDKVGRRFPFCLVASLQAHEFPASLLANPPNWYTRLISLADRVNDPDYEFDELQIELAELADNSEPATDLPVETTVGTYPPDFMRIVADSSTALTSNAGSGLLLDSVLSQFAFQYSLWVTHTRTDEGITFLTNGLPDTTEGTALFDQRWDVSPGVFIHGFGNTLHADTAVERTLESATIEKHKPPDDIVNGPDNQPMSETFRRHDAEHGQCEYSASIQPSKPKPNVETLEIDEDSESSEPWER